MLQIETSGATFIDGQTVVGFGSSDIVVKQVSVVSPTRLLVNVSISPTASVTSAHLSVASGLQVISQQYAFEVLPPARRFWLSSNITNATTGVPGVTAGAQAVLTIGNSPVSPTSGNATLFLNDQATPILGVANNRITFQVPANANPGGVAVRVEVSGERSSPILMIVDPPLPKILSASPDNQAAGSALKLGDLVALTVSDLEIDGAAVDTGRIAVKLAGVAVRVAQVIEQSDLHKVLVYVPETSPTGSELPLTVSSGNRTSEPINVLVEN